LPPQVEEELDEEDDEAEGLGLLRPGGGRDGAAEPRGPGDTCHSSWEEPGASLPEMGPGDQVDFMSGSLPGGSGRAGLVSVSARGRNNRQSTHVTLSCIENWEAFVV